MNKQGVLTPEERDALLRLSAPLVVDAMDRLGLPERVLDPGIRPVVPFSRMVGTALTVLLRSQSDRSKACLGTYGKAFEKGGKQYCPIIVVEVPRQHHHQGIFGEGAATSARRNGFVGALIEGAVRDTHDLQRLSFPAFSRTIAPGYICGKVDAVSCGEPVCVGGVTIQAGEIIFADNDGVVVIDPSELGPVIEKAQAIERWEHEVHRMVAQGCSSEEIEREAGPMP
jgi:4-hydroxy-4-methyl-2-oxoglutarate aldolase